MNATYILLNLIFFTLVAIAAGRRMLALPRRAILITVAAMLLLTAVFDPLIIWADIVGYDASKLLGIYIAGAPVEDFAYAIIAALAVPVLWEGFKKRDGND